jgi:hypothetical protein
MSGRLISRSGSPGPSTAAAAAGSMAAMTASASAKTVIVHFMLKNPPLQYSDE